MHPRILALVALAGCAEAVWTCEDASGATVNEGTMDCATWASVGDQLILGGAPCDEVPDAVGCSCWFTDETTCTGEQND